MAEPAYDIGICTDQPECPSRGSVSWQLTLIAGQTSLLSQPPDATLATWSLRLGKYPSRDSTGTSNQVSPQEHTPDNACLLGGEVRLDLLRSATTKQPQEPNPLTRKDSPPYSLRSAPYHPSASVSGANTGDRA